MCALLGTDLLPMGLHKYRGSCRFWLKLPGCQGALETGSAWQGTWGPPSAWQGALGVGGRLRLAGDAVPRRHCTMSTQCLWTTFSSTPHSRTLGRNQAHRATSRPHTLGTVSSTKLHFPPQQQTSSFPLSPTTDPTLNPTTHHHPFSHATIYSNVVCALLGENSGVEAAMGFIMGRGTPHSSLLPHHHGLICHSKASRLRTQPGVKLVAFWLLSLLPFLQHGPRASRAYVCSWSCCRQLPLWGGKRECRCTPYECQPGSGALGSSCSHF